MQIDAIRRLDEMLRAESIDYDDVDAVVWTTEPFGDERRALCGVQARVIPLEVLRSGKQRPREGDDDAAEDIADFRALGFPT